MFSVSLTGHLFWGWIGFFPCYPDWLIVGRVFHRVFHTGIHIYILYCYGIKPYKIQYKTSKTSLHYKEPYTGIQ